MNDQPSVSASTTNGPVIVSWSPVSTSASAASPRTNPATATPTSARMGRLSQGAAMNSSRLPHGSSA